MVHRPDGTSALVAIRRNRPRSRMRTPWEAVTDVAFLTRRLRGDRSWRIELFRGADDDIGMLPGRDPDQRWVVSDHDAAIAGAEVLCDLLRRGEPPGIVT